MRKVFLYALGGLSVGLLFLVLAPVAIAWPSLAWRNRISLVAGRLWGRFCLWVSGIRVEYEGLEHLTHPAILTFNHTSYLDFFFNAHLAGKRCLVFGKAELARLPFLGWGWYMGGHPLIRRDDRGHWQGQLDRAEILMRDRGYSTCIAPEGRRSRTGELLPFKKGTFHLAVGTGLPVVPVVIVGGADLMRGVAVPRPGTIRVKVLPPIPTEDWTLDGLEAQVANIRALYERELSGVAISAA